MLYTESINAPAKFQLKPSSCPLDKMILPWIINELIIDKKVQTSTRIKCKYVRMFATFSQ